MRSWLRRKLSEDCACGSGESYSRCCLCREAGYLSIGAGAGLILFFFHSTLHLVIVPVLLVAGGLGLLLRRYCGTRKAEPRSVSSESWFRRFWPKRLMAGKPQSTKVPNWLAAIILLVFCALLLGFSQPVNMWRVERWIEKHEAEWSQFVAENPQAKDVRFAALTNGYGVLGILMGEIDEETAFRVREFVSKRNPPRPAYYVSVSGENRWFDQVRNARTELQLKQLISGPSPSQNVTEKEMHELLSWLISEDSFERFKANVVIGVSGAEHIPMMLKILMSTQNRELQTAIVVVFGNLGEDAREVLPELRRIPTGQDDRLDAALAFALQRIEGPVERQKTEK